MYTNVHLPTVTTHLFGIVDTLEVKGRNVGAIESLSSVLLVAGEDLALQICTHRMHLVLPAGVRGAEKVV